MARTQAMPFMKPDRRTFLKSVATGVAAASLTEFSPGRGQGLSPEGISHLYDGLRPDEFFDGAIEVVARVADEENFTEGPAVDARGRVYFTNIPASKIYRWDPDRKELSLFRDGSHHTNGLCFDAEWNLLACESSARRITRTDLRTGEVTVLAERFESRPLEGPNDLVVDARGRIYFSSRPATHVPKGGNANALYRIDPDRSLHQLVREPDVHMPNGIAISPDQETLYLIEAHPGADRNRHIRVYDLETDGGLAEGRVLIDFYPGRSGDGMAVDVEGNLYVAAGLHRRRDTSETLDTRPGIHVISPSGRLTAFVETPEDTVTNCTFGGADSRTLYITAGSLLLSVRTRIQGYRHPAP